MIIELTIEVPPDEDPLGFKQDINRSLTVRSPIRVSMFAKTTLVEVKNVRVL